MGMLFRESGKKGNETVRLIRTFYCSEIKGARQKTLGKIKKADVDYLVETTDLFNQMNKNEATESEINEVKEWLKVMCEHKEQEALVTQKNTILSSLKYIASTSDDVIKKLTEADQIALFDHIKKFEDRLREHDIRRSRKSKK